MAASSCDTFVALPPATANGRVIFGKNSDRPSSEVQEVVFAPAADHASDSKVECTYISIDQVAHTHAVILSKPAWMWGAEMGANEQGVCVGNEAVWTKLNGPSDLEEKLLGMDLVRYVPRGWIAVCTKEVSEQGEQSIYATPHLPGRLALERASTASEAVDVIGQLLESPGQGGPCSEEPGQQAWSYHNSFLIADATCAWVLETAGPYWAAEHVTEGVRNISNELSIGTKMDRSSSNLVEEAKKRGLYKDEMGPFHFANAFSDSGTQKSFRYRHGLEMLKELSSSGQFGPQEMFKILRDEESGICMTDGSFLTTSSQVSVLIPPTSSPCPAPSCHWFTATPNPLTSIFKPFVFVPGVSVGTATASPQFGDDDPVRKTPRFQNQVDRRHALYRGHETLRELLGQEAARGLTVLGQLRELEQQCVQDMDELLSNFSQHAHAKVAAIFQHMAHIELNFYK